MEFGRKGLFDPQTSVVIKRDFWVFFREPSQWLHMLLMVLLLLIFLISLSTLDVKLTQPFLRAVTFLVVFLFNGFLVGSVALRFVFPSVSLESDTFWCVRSSPLSLRKLYLLKLGVSLFIVLFIAESLSVASLMMLLDDMVLAGFGAIAGGFIALALTSLNLGAGSYFAVFKEKNPVRVASSQGASVTFLASMIYLIVIVSVLVMPVTKYFETSALAGAASSQGLVVPAEIIAILSLVLFVASTTVGLRSIKGDVKTA